MALDALWTLLNPEVSGVSKVQAPVYAGLRDTPEILPEVSGVSDTLEGGAGAAMGSGIDTPDTPQENVRYQAKPAWIKACTLDTPDTCKIIDTEANAANDLLESELLTVWKVTVPPGTSTATLAKFRAASLALDVAQTVAGGMLTVPGERIAPTEAPSIIGTPTADLPVSKKGRGPWLTEREQAAAQAYNLHHFRCKQCIAAGLGDLHVPRCELGLHLWAAHQFNPATKATP